MSTPFTPSKRPHDRNHTESDERGQRQKLGGNFSQSQSSKSSHSDVIVRILCPVSSISGIIGNNGTIISQISQETGVKIRVEETVPGSDESVVVIASSKKEPEASILEQSKEDIGEEANMGEEIDNKRKIVRMVEARNPFLWMIQNLKSKLHLCRRPCYLFLKESKENLRRMELTREIVSLQQLL